MPALGAGVRADRVDRRTVVLVALFLLGTAEVFADTTSSTLLPMLVAHALRVGRDVGRGVSGEGISA